VLVKGVEGKLGRLSVKGEFENGGVSLVLVGVGSGNIPDVRAVGKRLVEKESEGIGLGKSVVFSFNQVGVRG